MTSLDAVEFGEMEPSESVELFQRTVKMMEVGSEVIEDIGRILEEIGMPGLCDHFGRLIRIGDASSVIKHREITSRVTAAAEGAPLATAEVAYAPMWGERIKHVGSIV